MEQQKSTSVSDNVRDKEKNTHIGIKEKQLLYITLIMSVFLCACFFLTAIAHADGNIVQWRQEGDTVYVEGEGAFIGFESDAIAKSTVLHIVIGEGVTQIDEKAFSGFSVVESLSLPDSLQRISDSAFSGCSSLQELELPPELLYIGDGAFSGCSSITSVVVPDSVTYIGSGTFKNVPLESLSIPFVGRSQSDSTKLSSRSPLGFIFGSNWVNSDTAYVDNAIFQYYDGYYSYYWYFIPDTLRSVTVTNAQAIAPQAFMNCDKITSITINSDITSIGEKAFKKCKLSSIIIPEGITTIEKETFAYCTNLQHVTLPSTLEIIKDYAFQNCSALNGVVFGPKLSSIGNFAFDHCSSIDEISFPNSLTSIGQYAFAWCSSITEIIVPQSVTYINDFAFRGTSLVSLEVPFIGNTANSSDKHLGAIFGCRSLNSSTGSVDDAVLQHVEILDETYCVVSYDWYYIPSTLRSVTITGSNDIPAEAFWNCYFLTNISIPNGAQEIGEAAFKNCVGLRTFNIPSSVVVIQNEAFYNCLNLGSLILPQGLAAIGENAFYNCSSVGIEKLPDEMVYVGKYAFYGCTSLYSIIIPDGIEKINEGTFKNCSGLTQVYTGDNCAIIGVEAFSGCTSLNSVLFSDCVQEIWTEGFRGCTSLSEINFPLNLILIDSYAFAGCNLLKNIVVPDSVNTIGEGAFRINGIESLTLPFIGTTRNSAGKNAVFGYIFGYRTLNSNTGSVDGATYQLFESPYYYWYYIPSTLTSVTITGATVIPDYAFNNCSQLTSINVQSDITSIGKYAFNKCSITSFTLPETVEEIGNYAFNQSKIQEIVIPSSVTMIGSYAFYETPLQSIYFSTGLNSIGSYAFGGCDQLTSIDLPSGLQSIQEGAFSRLNKITSLIVPDSVTYIQERAFSGMSGLTSLSIPFVGESRNSKGYESVFGVIFGERTLNSSDGSVDNAICQIYINPYYYWYYIPASLTSVTITNTDTIPAYAFNKCTNINEINIVSNIASIGEYAFNKCSLTSFSIPETVETIGDYAFNTNKLQTINIPEGIKTIGSYAFYSNRIQHIVIPEEIVSIGSYAFGNNDLQELVIPEGITEIADGTFCNNSFQTICFPNDLKSIGSAAFSGCGSLTHIDLPDGLQIISDSAFSGANSVTMIDVPDSVTYIGAGAFKISGLTRISIPFVGNKKDATGYKSVFGYIFGFRSFSSSTATEDNATFQLYVSPYYYWYYIPSSLQVVEITGECDFPEKAFINCKNIKQLIIDGQIGVIGKDAFKNSDITRVDIPNITTWLNIKFKNTNSRPTNNIFIDGKLLESLEIPEGTTIINAYAFSGNNHITSVTIPHCITQIEYEAFYSCTSLMSVDYDGDRLDKKNIIVDGHNGSLLDALWNFNSYGRCGEDLTYSLNEHGVLMITGSGAMFDFSDDIQPWNPANVSAIQMPASLTAIGNNAFAHCAAVKNIELPSALTSIGINAFMDCGALQSITIPADVISLEDGTFTGCITLKVYLHDQIASISQSAFGENGVADVTCIYCNPSTATSACLGAINQPFSIVGYEYVLMESEGIVQVIQYAGTFDSVIIPDNIMAWENTTNAITSLKLPATLDNSCNFTLSAKDITVPNGVINLGHLTLSGVEKLIVPNSVTNLDNLTISGKAPVIYCFMDSDTETWALANEYDIYYLDDGWEPVFTMTYTGQAINLDVGETYTLHNEDIAISPIPDEEVILSVNGNEHISVDGMILTAIASGNYEVTASFYGNTVAIPVHVYQQILSFDLVAPRFVEKDEEFVVSIDNVTPSDTSSRFTWQVTGGEGITDNNLDHTFVISELPGSLLLTVTAPSGISRTVTIAAPQSISNPYASTNNQSAVVGAIIDICVDVDGQTYRNDPDLYQSININSSATKVIEEMDDHRIRVIAPGRCAFTVVGYNGDSVNIRVVASDPIGILTLPTSLTVISEEAFSGIMAQKIIIPITCQRIEKDAFADSNVAIVIIPSCVESIDDDAFARCNNLTVITNSTSGIVADWCIRNDINWYVQE